MTLIPSIATKEHSQSPVWLVNGAMVTCLISLTIVLISKSISQSISCPSQFVAVAVWVLPSIAVAIYCYCNGNRQRQQERWAATARAMGSDCKSDR